MDPLITNVSLALDKPSPSDKRADRERLVDGLAQMTGNDFPVEIGPDILSELHALLRKNNFSITLTLGFTGDRTRIIALDKKSVFSVAVDIGTTNIVASLFSTGNATKLGSMEIENPQVSEGLDVLTRMHASMSGKRAELHVLLMKGINDLIRKLCNAYSIQPSDICAAAIAGNTVMTHFLMDLPVDSIPVEPYIPVANRFDFMSPSDIGLGISPSAIVYVFPNAGSYVGGDIISGILSSGLYKSEKPSFLVDVGTNAEIVLGCNEWIIVGAGAAGPALESGISEIGMRAEDGAIYGVEISGTDEVGVRTINDNDPVGICGSGMIELISELYKAGIVDRQGKFTGKSGKIKTVDGIKAFVVYESGSMILAIKDTDIENFLRSKAAMFASLYVIVKSVGLGFRDIAGFYVSGAFGKGIDAGKAVSIGMLPDISRDKFLAIGNSSLRGAEMLLADKGLLADIDSICRIVTYREMNADGEFMKEFPGALFIPHTDPEILR